MPEATVTVWLSLNLIEESEFLITIPRMPASEIKTLLPLPRIVMGIFSSPIKFRTLINSSFDEVWMNRSAGPPILTVV